MKESREFQEKILLYKACQGDSDAFGVFFDKYSKRIYRFIYYKVPIAEVAEDLTSQCFLKVWEQISAKVRVRKIHSWIYRIARNLVTDYYRGREKEELPLIYPSEQQDGEMPKFDPDQELDLKQLEKILFALKGEAREIIVLRYIEELSISEVAKIVDKSQANVRVIIHRALKELQNYIK